MVRPHPHLLTDQFPQTPFCVFAARGGLQALPLQLSDSTTIHPRHGCLSRHCLCYRLQPERRSISFLFLGQLVHTLYADEVGVDSEAQERVPSTRHPCRTWGVGLRSSGLWILR